MSISIPDTEYSLWHGSSDKTSFPQLDSDLTADAVIVGGGIAGLTTAYLLKQSGLSVVVLEKNIVAAGSSGKTTGKVTSQHNLIYAKLTKAHGKKIATLYGQANQEAIAQIKEIIDREKIDCDWESDDNYVYTTDPKQVEHFRDEAKAAADCGLPATFVTNCPLPFPIAAAVKFSGQAKFNARKYVLGLAKAVNGDGSYVFEQTRATKINDGDPGTVKTAHGTINATHVIVTTKVPTFPLAARATYAGMEYPQFSYLVAGKLNTKLEGMYISPDSGQYSILPIEVGGDHYLLVGGENHIPGSRFDFKKRHQKLADYAQKHFGIEKIEYRWKAWDYLSYDDMPLAGKLYPWSKHLFTATGFMKWGLTNSMVCARVLVDNVHGRKSELSETFSTTRSGPVTSIPKAIPEIISKL